MGELLSAKKQRDWPETGYIACGVLTYFALNVACVRTAVLWLREDTPWFFPMGIIAWGVLGGVVLSCVWPIIWIATALFGVAYLCR